MMIQSNLTSVLSSLIAAGRLLPTQGDTEVAISVNGSKVLLTDVEIVDGKAVLYCEEVDLDVEFIHLMTAMDDIYLNQRDTAKATGMTYNRLRYHVNEGNIHSVFGFSKNKQDNSEIFVSAASVLAYFENLGATEARLKELSRSLSTKEMQDKSRQVEIIL